MKYTVCITRNILTIKPVVLLLIVFVTFVFLNNSFAQFQSTVNFPLYVGDSEYRIAVIDADGNITKYLPSEIPSAQSLLVPAGLAFDSDGTLYLAESGRQEISTIDVNTGVRTPIVERGNGLLIPSGLAFDCTGKLYVSEYGDELEQGSGEISVVEPDTGEVTLIAEGLNGPLGIAFDKDGILYVAESLSGTISKIDPRGETEFPLEVSNVAGGFMGPNGITFGNDGLLYVSELAGLRISSVDVETYAVKRLNITLPEGEEFMTPNKIAFDSDGFLYITDLYPTDPINAKIWKVNLDTKEAEIFADGLKVPAYLAFTGQLDALLPKPAPEITNVEPNNGPSSGGTVVTITGENFFPKAKVLFGSNQAIDIPVVVNESGTEIIALSPSGEVGKQDVIVENWDGQAATLSDGFTYISSLLGDVSGDGEVSAYDASLILQFVVGLITEFPAEVVSSPTDLSPRNHTVSVPDLSVTPDGRVRAPIVIDDASGITSGGIVLTYDADILKVIEVTPSGMMSGYYWQYRVQGNQIRIAFAGVHSATGAGALFYIECESNTYEAGQQSPIILEKVQLSNSLNIKKIHGTVEILPARTALLPNYPNPFNPATWIPYQLANDAIVTISIYNAKGQLIHTIELGDKRAGVYATKERAGYWDGTDNLGQPVASGVYFYTLQAGKFQATSRMVILK